jgi:hypothetical protein
MMLAYFILGSLALVAYIDEKLHHQYVLGEEWDFLTPRHPKKL